MLQCTPLPDGFHFSEEIGCVGVTSTNTNYPGSGSGESAAGKEPSDQVPNPTLRCVLNVVLFVALIVIFLPCFVNGHAHYKFNWILETSAFRDSAYASAAG